MDVRQQHAEICELANNFLKQWYVKETGKDPLGIKFFKFDYIPKNGISGIFQWPQRQRKYCQIVLFRDELDKPPDGLYLREIFNLAHELGHFTDYAKNGKTYNTAKASMDFLERVVYFYGEIKANIYGIRFIKNLDQKALFLGFALLSLLYLASGYFFARQCEGFIRKIYINWYIYGVMK